MKASDFTTTSSQRDAASQALLQTEQTDAVNSGIVGKADKSERSLKSALYSVGKKTATGGATSAALAAVTKGRRGASTAEPSSASGFPIPGSDAAAPDGAIGTVISPSTGGRRKGRSAQPGASTGTASGGSRRGAGRSSFGTASGAAETASGATSKGGRFGESLKAGVKRAGRGTALGAATRKTLEDTELEGADDLYYKGKGAYRIARGVKRRLSGKDVMQADKPLGQLSEKKSAKRAADTLKGQRNAQASSYFKRTVYTTAEKAKSAGGAVKGIVAVTGHGGGGGILAAVSPTSVFLPLILILLFFLLIIGGMGADETQKKSTGSLQGVPAEVATALKGYGYTNEAIAAVLGNMQQESSMNPGSAGDDGYGTDSVGLIQLSGSNKNRFLRWCANNGKAWYSVAAQIEWSFSGEPGTGYYIDDWGLNLAEPPSYYRLERGYEERFGTDFYRDPQQLKSSTDVDLATYSWMACHERPGSKVSYGDDVSRLNKRLEYAHDFLAKLNSGSVGGEEYDSAEPWQKAIVDAADPAITPSPGEGWCAMWVSRVYVHAGFPYPGGNADDMYRNWCHSADRSQLKVGMMVAVDQYLTKGPAHAGYTPDGRPLSYHVGIYMGNGMVRDNIGPITDTPLDEWIATYGNYHEVRWGFPPGAPVQ